MLQLFAGAKGRSSQVLDQALCPPEPERFLGVDWGRWDHMRSSRYRQAAAFQQSSPVILASA